MFCALALHLGQGLQCHCHFIRHLDGAVGSAGFLVEAFEFMCQSKSLTTSELKILQTKSFYGAEKKTLAYIIGIFYLKQLKKKNIKINKYLVILSDLLSIKIIIYKEYKN